MNENGKSKYIVHVCLTGTPLGSVKMQSTQLSQVTEFKWEALCRMW